MVFVGNIDLLLPLWKCRCLTVDRDRMITGRLEHQSVLNDPRTKIFLFDKM